MIDKSTIARIQEAAQIVDVVSDFVTLKKRGVNYLGLCPFHDDRTPSFSVSPSKNICKCFSCGEGGTAVHFIMKHEQLSYYEALKYLAKKYNIEVKERELTNEEKMLESERESLFIINEFARTHFKSLLYDNQEGRTVGLTYFKERGFRDDIIKKFELGYALEQRNAFSTEALRLGYKKDFLLKTGLVAGGENDGPLYDRFRGRVIFPVHTLSGKVVAFGGRILRKADNLAKYVNSPESEIYSKSRELYGIFFAKRAVVKADNCFLVEGYTDVLSMHQAGIENVVSSSGTALTSGQIRLIRRFTQNMTVLYDGDDAGITAALRGIDLLLEEGMNVKVVLLPKGEDPDSFARKQNAESFNKFIADNAVDFIRFKTQLLLNETKDDPIKRAGLISNIVQSIALIPDGIKRSVYMKDSANLLEINEKLLIQEVNKIRKRSYNQRQQRSSQQRASLNSKKEQQAISESTDKEIKTPIPARRARIDNLEQEIIRYIVRYGMNFIFQRYEKQKRGNGKQTEEIDVLVEEGSTVIEFVYSDLERDNIKITNPLYSQIFEEAYRESENPDFQPAKYFMSHSDSSISKCATDMLNDKYQLSKIHAKSLGEEIDDEKSRLLEENLLEILIPRVTTELKNVYILKQIERVMRKIKEAERKNDFETTLKLLEEKRKLEEIKKILAKMLGEQVIIRY
ncbi:MAG: DNA primase [Dysgonamonadaceae bacterium]|jgi:DNA primase|nr:DNA primase [Dysgonamonadaceae bacterium]MDD3356569.1 DNA primase [Dysgonamonadaceae bacterium]MDD3727867.1 DNA primase [Dysgonamonadaceae bacterium]MDD4246784.1 DNA primase [Dysgonamonadaceae bacterium]MDD4606297.1 DNA primase [Dysgonamonadaceae bacterium]